MIYQPCMSNQRRYLGKVVGSERSLTIRVTEYDCSLQPWTRQSGKRCANPFISLNHPGKLVRDVRSKLSLVTCIKGTQSLFCCYEPT
jgi:biotin carboxylase